MANEYFLFFDEDEEDVESALSSEIQKDLRETIVYNLDWTIESVLSQLEKGAIDLQPQYQRRDAWTLERKSKLVESLILGLPVPHIVLAERHDQKGSFIVLDGKQRLTTLAQFAGKLPDSPSNGFALTKLPLLNELEGFSFAQMLKNERLVQRTRAFLNQPLKSAILRGWKSEDFLHIVFHRLNSQVVPLSPQELRQALIRGPFMLFLNDYSARSASMRWLLNLDGPDFRMRDSELFLRLLGLTHYQEDYRGNLRLFLDNVAAGLSKKWDELSERTEAELRSIEDALELLGIILGKENVGRKYINGSYEGRLNRAVLDAQVYSALDADASEKMKARPVEAKSAFEALMQADDDFRRAIEQTTKSVEAVRYRMRRLRDAMRAV